MKFDGLNKLIKILRILPKQEKPIATQKIICLILLITRQLIINGLPHDIISEINLKKYIKYLDNKDPVS